MATMTINKLQHTPGPWKISEESPTIIKQDFSSIGIPNGGVIIGSASGYTGSGYFPDDDTAKANAVLMASAPDLLELLQFAVEVYHKCDCPFGKVYAPNLDNCNCNYHAKYLETLQAIAKVTK